MIVCNVPMALDTHSLEYFTLVFSVPTFFVTSLNCAVSHTGNEDSISALGSLQLSMLCGGSITLLL